MPAHHSTTTAGTTCSKESEQVSAVDFFAVAGPRSPCCDRCVRDPRRTSTLVHNAAVQARCLFVRSIVAFAVSVRVADRDDSPSVGRRHRRHRPAVFDTPSAISAARADAGGTNRPALLAAEPRETVLSREVAGRSKVGLVAGPASAASRFFSGATSSSASPSSAAEQNPKAQNLSGVRAGGVPIRVTARSPPKAPPSRSAPTAPSSSRGLRDARAVGRPRTKGT